MNTKDLEPRRKYSGVMRFQQWNPKLKFMQAWSWHYGLSRMLLSGNFISVESSVNPAACRSNRGFVLAHI